MKCHIYPLVLLHIVQVCLLTNAEIEEFLPLIPHQVSLSLEMKYNLITLLHVKFTQAFTDGSSVLWVIPVLWQWQGVSCQ